MTIRDAGGNVETLRTTDEHPFHVTGVGWTRAGGLAVGQVLSEADGTNDAAVIGTERVERPEGLAVYNLEVEGDHTYFVEDGRGGKTALWVHNNYFSFKWGHGARHVEGTGLSVQQVEAAIEESIGKAIKESASVNGRFMGRVDVNGTHFEYRANVMDDVIFVGTYYPKP